jgi:hypothetical protein
VSFNRLRLHALRARKVVVLYMPEQEVRLRIKIWEKIQIKDG